MAKPVLSFNHHEITEIIQQKAVEELNETLCNKENSLNLLKKMIQGEENLTPNLSDNFLLQFLRVKKFDTEKAFQLLKKYYSHRQYYRTLYKKYTPQQHLHVMRINMMNFLPWRSPEGCALWVAKCGLWETETINFEDVIRFGLICVEKAIQNPITQISGILTIVDMKGFSWSHLFHISPSNIKCCISALQNCFPIRHKAIHVINNPRVFDVLFSMIKPLLNKVIKNRIFFHGDRMSSLHQFIPPDLLPEEYGGTREKFGNPQFYKLLLDSEEEFVQNNKFGYGDDEN